MSWRDEPATSPQLTAIRDFYWESGMGYEKAMSKVHELKMRGITKGEASDKLAKLKEAHDKGTLNENVD